MLHHKTSLVRNFFTDNNIPHLRKKPYELGLEEFFFFSFSHDQHSVSLESVIVHCRLLWFILLLYHKIDIVYIPLIKLIPIHEIDNNAKNQ